MHLPELPQPTARSWHEPMHPRSQGAASSQSTETRVDGREAGAPLAQRPLPCCPWEANLQVVVGSLCSTLAQLRAP